MRWLVRRMIVLKHPFETGQAPGSRSKRKASEQSYSNAKRHRASESDSESSASDIILMNPIPHPSRSGLIASISNSAPQSPTTAPATALNIPDVELKPNIIEPITIIDLSDSEDFDGVVVEFISKLTSDPHDRRVFRKNFKEMKATSEKDLDILGKLAFQSPGGFKEFTFVQLNKDHPILFSILASALWRRGQSIEVS